MSNQQGMFYQQPREQEAQRETNTDPREQAGAQQAQQQWQEPVAEAYSGYERGYADYNQGYGGTQNAYEQEKVRPQQPLPTRPGLTTRQLVLIIISIIILSNAFSMGHMGSIFGFFSMLAVLALVAYFLIFRQGIPSVTIPPQSFTVQEHARLVVKNPAGTINIVRGEGQTVEITGRQSTGGIFGSPWNTRVETRQQGDTIEVSIRQTSWQPSRIDLEIKLPPGCNVQIAGNAGAVDIDGIDGEAVVETNAGTINVRRAVLRGKSRLKTNAGTVDFSGTLAPGGSYRMESNLGTINAALTSDTSFVLDAKTDVGSVTNDFESKTVGNGPHARLELKTNLGTIDVHRL